MTAPLLTLVDVDGPGAHPALWVEWDPARSARAVADGVRAAERAGFTAAVLDDHPLPDAAPGGAGGRPEGLLRAAFAAPLTGAIGLIPVVHAVYNEPFHVATQLASLDIASAGRGGWIAVADRDPAIAARYGRTPLDDADAELVDVVEAVRRLWDSWEDDAVIRHVPSGRYLDRAKLHYADFRGARFSVKGPAIVPRPTQGQPITIGAAGTRAEVDAVLLQVRDLDAVPAAAAAARDAHPVARVLLRLEVVLDSAGLPAADRLERLDAIAAWSRTGVRYVGDAESLLALLGRLAVDVDGVRFVPADGTVDLDELGRVVLPALRAGGLSVAPRVGDTARRTWGLPHPVNRFLEHAR
ncbi:LLM class flavin-dependent oxidoreductase [uncultured Amnibacterium sp.]|uniref:LLM class flavin-dependent oxidoreductase n=1 Tax=uncultured Amnibacterium sp. TaxID=1631851 RepID=UPI0035CB92C1